MAKRSFLTQVENAVVSMVMGIVGMIGGAILMTAIAVGIAAIIAIVILASGLYAYYRSPVLWLAALTIWLSAIGSVFLWLKHLLDDNPSDAP